MRVTGRQTWIKRKEKRFLSGNFGNYNLFFFYFLPFYSFGKTQLRSFNYNMGFNLDSHLLEVLITAHSDKSLNLWFKWESSFVFINIHHWPCVVHIESK